MEIVVHVERFVDGSRRVAAISQVLGTASEGFAMEDLFHFEVEQFAEGKMRGNCRYTGAKPQFLAKFHMNNIALPSWVQT